MNNSLKHIDIDLLMDIFGGDEEIICESIEVFSDIANTYFSTIIETHSIKDWYLLGATSHKAKASCRTMGMAQLGDSLEKVEKHSKGLKYQELLAKRDLNKEEEKLFTSLQKSGFTHGNMNSLDTEISFIKINYKDAIDEIRNIKTKLNKD